MTEQSPVSAPVSVFDSQAFEKELALPQPSGDPAELSFELMLWIDGISSYLNSYEKFIGEKDTVSRDWTKEFRITYAGLLRASELSYLLQRALTIEGAADHFPEEVLNNEELRLISADLRDSIVLSSGLLRAGPLTFDEWSSWRRELHSKFQRLSKPEEFFAFAPGTGTARLPRELAKLFASEKLSNKDREDLKLIVPAFAKVLRSLGLIGKMLTQDAPLKPALLIFAGINDRTIELITYLKNHLARHSDEQSELYGLLDGAIYTTTLEMKKVINQELKGLIDVRPAPSVFASIETAYEILNDCFRYILTGFARMGEPEVQTSDIFPEFRSKLESSVILRERLWKILRSVQRAEQTPEQATLDALRKDLADFLDETVTYLFFKDQETVERFCEEVMAASGSNDVVPILHRFAAYIETLFGQVNMRAILASYPFNPKD